MPSRPSSCTITHVQQHRHVTLDLEIGTDPISGCLRDKQGSCVHFAGWLELASALEQLLRASNSEPTHTQPRPR